MKAFRIPVLLCVYSLNWLIVETVLTKCYVCGTSEKCNQQQHNCTFPGADGLCLASAVKSGKKVLKTKLCGNSSFAKGYCADIKKNKDSDCYTCSTDLCNKKDAEVKNPNNIATVVSSLAVLTTAIFIQMVLSYVC